MVWKTYKQWTRKLPNIEIILCKIFPEFAKTKLFLVIMEAVFMRTQFDDSITIFILYGINFCPIIKN